MFINGMVSHHSKLFEHWGPVSRPLKYLTLMFPYKGHKQIKCCSSSYLLQARERGWGILLCGPSLIFWCETQTTEDLSGPRWGFGRLDGLQLLVHFLQTCWMISIWATNTHKPSICYSFSVISDLMHILQPNDLHLGYTHKSSICYSLSVISYLVHFSQLWWASPSGLKIHTNQAFAILFLWFRSGTLSAAVLNDLCNITSHITHLAAVFISLSNSVCLCVSSCPRRWLRACTNFTQASYSYSHSSKWNSKTCLTDGYPWNPPWLGNLMFREMCVCVCVCVCKCLAFLVTAADLLVELCMCMCVPW